jgi:hypothetical protein
MRHVLLAFIFFIQDVKVQIPTAADQDAARKVVRGLFKIEYAAVDRIGRRTAAKKLLEASNGANNVTERYVLLRDAIDIATKANDPWTAFKAAERMATSFQTDLEELRASIIANGKKIASSPEEAGIIAEACLTLWEWMMTAENYEAAERWAKEAEQIAKNAKDGGLIQSSKEMGLEAAETKKEKERAAKAETILKDNPKDQAANGDLGSYLCFARCDWEKGVSYLLETDGFLLEMAKKETIKAADAETQFDVGKAWLSASEKEKNPIMRRRFATRGRHWLETALKSADGLLKRKLLKRLWPNITIIKATYGAGKTVVDITKEVQDCLEQNPRSPIKADQFIKADPAFGTAKTLTVEYTLDGQRLKETAVDGDVVLIANNYKGTPLLGATTGFSILWAHYGVGVTFTDVTEQARRGIADPTTPYDSGVCNMDPYPGKSKSVVVVFDWHGRRFVRVAKEGEKVTLMK